jgi:hypothetical protein
LVNFTKRLPVHSTCGETGPLGFELVAGVQDETSPHFFGETNVLGVVLTEGPGLRGRIPAAGSPVPAQFGEPLLLADELQDGVHVSGHPRTIHPFRDGRTE